MRNQNGKIWLIFIEAAFLAIILCGTGTAADKWPGIDESVVEKIAKEHGREAREPFINTDKGDLLLFAFLTAGSIAGFAAGYYWRKLMEQKRKE